MSDMKQLRERQMRFNEWSIKRILDSAKSQTRRVIKPQPPEHTTYLAAEDLDGRGWLCVSECGDGEFPPDVEPWRKCPYGQAGDVLYVRETFSGASNVTEGHSSRLVYRADVGDKRFPCPCGCGAEQIVLKWTPSIHMPKWASRIWLRVEDVRAERVQDISEEDAIAEGIGHGFQMNSGWPDYQHIDDNGHCTLTQDTPVMSFATLWDDINANRDSCSWADNPFVWAISFSVLSTTGKPAEH